MTAAPRRAVYTALFGGYEELCEQPVAVHCDVPFICFTDDPDLTSETWDVRVVPPLLPLDPTRSARALKLTGHDDLAAYDETLWLDARVLLRVEPSTVLDAWLDGSDLTVPRHSYRADVVSEFEQVLLLGYDDSSRLYEQLTHYSVLAPELLEAPVPWTALVARRRTPRVELAGCEWLTHVLRYSRRDQLSFVHVMAAAGLDPRLVDLDNHVSDLHEWRRGQGRSSRRALLRVAESLRPPTARLGELRLELDRTAADMADAVAARERRIAELEATLHQLQSRVDELTVQRERKQEKIRELRQRLQRTRGRSSVDTPRG